MSDWLIDLYFGAHVPSSPSALFGTNISKWPAWWHDAVMTLLQARDAADEIEQK